MNVVEVDTPKGPARAHLYAAEDPPAALVLGHGAAGGVDAPDLVAARRAAGLESISVALVEQPYRVAGRRSPAGAAQLDAAWTAVVENLRADELGDLPLIVGAARLAHGSPVAPRRRPVPSQCSASRFHSSRRSALASRGRAAVLSSRQ